MIFLTKVFCVSGALPLDDGGRRDQFVVSFPFIRTLTKSECASEEEFVRARSWMKGSAVVEAPSRKSP